eukprot:TRINITY_DN14498_c0_g1_i1.p1 TRINITY_DN14498_c0_g1~~TRINITY_DN14498_c0_g1_i1.p1  ORF type:complete len:192 (+),score=19.92 TRINITY_DN14498_c0_g1_i1:82-657(+)
MCIRDRLLTSQLKQKLAFAKKKSAAHKSFRIANKSKLLEVFLQCMEEVKSQIAARALSTSRSFISSSKTRPLNDSFTSYRNMQRRLSTNRLANFTTTDKKRVLIHFMNNPEVYDIMKKILKGDAIDNTATIVKETNDQVDNKKNCTLKKIYTRSTRHENLARKNWFTQTHKIPTKTRNFTAKKSSRTIINP